MNIALVFPPFFHPSMYNLPPMGLISLAGQLTAGGHAVTVHDQILALREGVLSAREDLYDRCARMILAENPDMVGFSVQCTTFPPVIGIAERIRRLAPAVRIVLGGHSVSFAAEQTLARFPCVDAVVRGEGELTFRELADAWSRGIPPASVEGVSYREGRRIVRNPERALISDLDLLPLPDYSLVPPLDRYRHACDLPRSVAILEVGRGCPHACCYCSESAMWRRRSRTFSVDRIVSEMALLKREEDAGCFLLAYDQFTADRAFAEGFCRALLDSGLDSRWYCISRLDTVDAGLLALMREAGCESLCYGIDSGSPRTLSFIRKRIDPSLLLRRVRETTEQGIVPTLSFIVGMPCESPDDLEATFDLALRSAVQGEINPLVQLPTVLPGTELHRRFRNRLVRGVDTYFSLGIEFDEKLRLGEDETRIASAPCLFSSFYNLPSCLDTALLHQLGDLLSIQLRLFPKSTLLLARMGTSGALPLFMHLWEYLGNEGEPSAPTGERCARLFPRFAEKVYVERGDGDGKWRHLPEVIRYESLCLEAGDVAALPRVGNIEQAGTPGWRPRRKGVLAESFRFNLPAILADLKNEIFHPLYPQDRVTLLFQNGEGGMEVTEVNPFGEALLCLCDGTRSLQEISGELFPRFGEDAPLPDFHEACRQAAQELGRMAFLD